MTTRSRRRGGTVAVSWGPWGGIYVIGGRLCLGWIALTYVSVEIDDLMEGYAAWYRKPSDEVVERGAAALSRFLFPGRIVPRLEMARAVLAAATDRRPTWHDHLPAKRVFGGDDA